ncbi:hypothetical protein JMA_35900 [Jeotgalibacillus malaysiensis]|uniref:Type 4 fimbrial biogenesis protein PilX N-terminal domain-containing protein n=1 Tax=Jeotgalibacillus malaysiensis TaxID=1508404 RepID=A0A0B5AW38_9BACL|nr:hypothetical protein [Jeotgalibacillus malaysiensis]AJD92907.1 hypothetical protein JMA_35900 [Jeotgalibacillus malaysiensis]
MMKRYIDNQRGYSLLLTIFAVMFISIVGVSILSFTLNTTRVTVNEQVNQSSYYIAEAGLIEKRAELNALATAAYEDILNGYNDMPAEDQAEFGVEGAFYSRVQSLIDEKLTFETTSTYEEQQSVTPFSTAKVTQISSSPLVYEISSAGTIPAEKTPSLTKELKQRVQIQMNVDTETEVVTIPGDGGTTKFQACFSVYAGGDFEHNGGPLKGPIYSNGKTTLSGGNASISGNIYSKGEVLLQGGSARVNGNVYTGQSVTVKGGGASVNGEIFENFNSEAAQIECVQKAPELPPAETAFPATNVATMPNETIQLHSNKHDVIKNGELNIDNYLVRDTNYVLKLNRDVYFKKISIKSDYQLTIDLQGEHRRIFVDDFDFQQGRVEFINPGKLEIIVQDDLKLTGGSSINRNNDTDQLIIRHAGNKKLTFAGATALNGSLHVKEADITLAGSNNIDGDLFAYGTSDIKITGGSNAADKLIIAPNSNLSISGGGSANGNIIVKDFSITGGGSVNPPDSDYGEWDGPGGEEDIEVIRYSEDGSFLRTDVLVEE